VKVTTKERSIVW